MSAELSARGNALLTCLYVDLTISNGASCRDKRRISSAAFFYRIIHTCSSPRTVYASATEECLCTIVPESGYGEGDEERTKNARLERLVASQMTAPCNFYFRKLGYSDASRFDA